MKITITGHPLVLKNSKQIIVVNGRRIIKSNPRVEAYQHHAIAEVCDQVPFGHKPITEFVHSKMMFFGAWKRTGKNNPDQSNLYQLPEDILEAAGVIEDDYLIEHHDGSRRVFMCDSCEYRPFFKAGPKKGTRKPDCGAIKRCPYERIEITIDPIDSLPLCGCGNVIITKGCAFCDECIDGYRGDGEG